MSQRQRDDMGMPAHIREKRHLSLQSYGRPRMSEKLQDLGVCFGQRRVGRLWRRNGIEISRTRKYSITNDSNHTVNIAPYLLGQDFSTTGPKPVMGRRYVLYLGQPRVALSRCHSLSILGE